MRSVSCQMIRDAVATLCVRANLFLRPDVLALLKKAARAETHPFGRDVLKAIVENAAVARREHLAICQDTGMPTVFIELGSDIHLNCDLNAAVNQGVKLGYKTACLRDSIVKDPLERGTPGFVPAVIHTEVTTGDKVRLTVLPKGFGCENKSALKMFSPTAGIEAVKEFVVETIKNAGPDACPPYVVGVGIGGTAEYAALLAKKALLKNLRGKKSPLEKDLERRINRLKIGPMGLGGKTTCLGASVLTYPTHIAGLPVAVNVSCHALRSATQTL